MRTPIHGHTSLETAYMIEDYPYGSLRCKRRVWLESDPRKGVRFVAQTQNPKNGRWNNPHKSTYVDVAACLYLDEKGYVDWTGIHAYTNPQEALAFVQTFGGACVGADTLKVWAAKKARLATALASGQAHFTVNGEKQDRSDSDKARDAQEAQVWAQVSELLAAG
jgi:hypothetical protein